MDSNENLESSEEETDECPELTSSSSISDTDVFDFNDSPSETSDSSLSNIGSDEEMVFEEQKEEKISFVIPKKTFIAGDIVEESDYPISKTIYRDFREDHCHHCMRKPQKTKKCSKCHQIYYCDKRCQQMDWKYHKNECKVFSHKKFKSEECFEKERLLIRLLVTVRSDPTFTATKHRLFDGTEVCVNDIEINTKMFSEDIERMIEFQMICNHFQSYGLKFERKELLRYYGFVISNDMTHSLLYFEEDLIRSDVGIGIFIETYNMRHSCTPNAAYVNRGFSLQIRAMKSIGTDHNITLSHMDLAKDRTERQTIVKTVFYSECKCDKCVQNLDKDIDYQKFHKDLHKIYSISNFGEMFGETYLSTIDIKEALNTFSEMSGLYCRVYGPYHPTLTAFLLQQFIAMFRLFSYMSESSKSTPNHRIRDNKAVLKQFYDICDTNMRVTYGTDHLYYRLFRRYSHLVNNSINIGFVFNLL